MMSNTSTHTSNPGNRPVILMVVGGLGAGGKEQQLLSLLKCLKERNRHSVILVAMNPNGLREEEARQYVDQLITIKRLVPFAFFHPLLRVIQIARRYKASVIHTWGSGIWDLLGLCASRWLKIPFLHGGIRSAPASLNFNNRVSRWSANHADIVVANSQAGLIALGQKNNPNARVIYNGLDLSRFKGVETEKIQHDMCMVANFSNHKDHKTLVNAMALIIKAIPGAKLLLVGHDAGTLNSTRELVNNLGLTESVVFVTDSMKPYQLIANSSVCILSTYSEGISNAILEYFAFSKPVIASDVVGNTEIIVPGKNGYLVEAGSAEALANKVIALLTNPELAKKLGDYGKEMVIEKFSVESMISSYETTYLDLLERSGGS